jgi:hypothetical protein
MEIASSPSIILLISLFGMIVAFQPELPPLDLTPASRAYRISQEKVTIIHTLVPIKLEL